mmetsp:Transcript_60117/g.156280  ORF Transcript_60117/g.156280 Transcript_60117/m.156280 type:complete len:296 (+) Transcript_60117:43-930(+)
MCPREPCTNLKRLGQPLLHCLRGGRCFVVLIWGAAPARTLHEDGMARLCVAPKLLRGLKGQQLLGVCSARRLIIGAVVLLLVAGRGGREEAEAEIQSTLGCASQADMQASCPFLQRHSAGPRLIASSEEPFGQSLRHRAQSPREGGGVDHVEPRVLRRGAPSLSEVLRKFHIQPELFLQSNELIAILPVRRAHRAFNGPHPFRSGSVGEWSRPPELDGESLLHVEDPIDQRGVHVLLGPSSEALETHRVAGGSERLQRILHSTLAGLGGASVLQSMCKAREVAVREPLVTVCVVH